MRPLHNKEFENLKQWRAEGHESHTVSTDDVDSLIATVVMLTDEIEILKRKLNEKEKRIGSRIR